MLHLEAVKTITHYSQLSNIHAAALEFEQLHGLLPATVDGQPLIGRCDSCKQLVFDGDPYEQGDTLVCGRCLHVAQAEDEDAGEDHVENNPGIDLA